MVGARCPSHPVIAALKQMLTLRGGPDPASAPPPSNKRGGNRASPPHRDSRSAGRPGALGRPDPASAEGRRARSDFNNSHFPPLRFPDLCETDARPGLSGPSVRRVWKRNGGADDSPRRSGAYGKRCLPRCCFVKNNNENNAPVILIHHALIRRGYVHCIVRTASEHNALGR